MRPTPPLLLLGAISCTSAQPITPPPDPNPHTYRSYQTQDGAQIHSTLIEHTELATQNLRGHTQLEDGSWLVEHATLDKQGHLLHAEIDRGSPCTKHPTHIVLDPKKGTVEINTAGIYTRWTVPNDLPWVPVGVRAGNTVGHHVATPVAMTIALRSAQSEPASRLVDIEHFTSFSIMSDQILSADAEPTVVLGDDYAEIQGDLPARVHLASLGLDIDANGPNLTAALARLRCDNPCDNADEGTAL